MPQRQSRTALCVRLGLFLIVVSLVGCGGNPAKVSGVVTLNGEPLSRGSVGFTPIAGGMKAVGVIQSDGNFELKTNRERGLQFGEHQATVVALEPGKVDPHGGPPIPGKHITPKRYGNTKTSGLQFNVEKGRNTIDIELSSEGLEEDNKPKSRRRRR